MNATLEPPPGILPGSLDRLRKILFRNVLRTIKAAKTGHLGACCSSLDLMLVLYFGGILRFDANDPRHPLRDYVLNRGHLGPLKYNVFSLLGWMEEEEMALYRQIGSRLAGHEEMALTPGVDISPCGSLGMGLSYAVGSLIGFQSQGMPNRVFCFLGDGEEEEGNVSEAARHAAHLKVKNLIAVIDRNGGQLSARLRETDSADLASVWRGYGWQVIDLEDGHDHVQIEAAYRQALELSENGPVCIVAKTVKGRGIPGAELDYTGFHVFHGSEVQETNETVRFIDIDTPLAAVEAELAGTEGEIDIRRPSLPEFKLQEPDPVGEIAVPEYMGDAVQYDLELQILGAVEEKAGERMFVLTSDYPPRSFVYGEGRFALGRCRYFNVGLREQHMTAMAHGIAQARKDAVIVVLCGDAFLYRHMDQINALAQAGTRVLFYSVQGGLSGAKNGPTHQSSGQSGAVAYMPGIDSWEPATGQDLLKATNAALRAKRPSYIRMHKLPVPFKLEGKDDGGYSLLSISADAQATVVSCGMTTLDAHQAVADLRREGIVCNLISVNRLSDCGGIGRWILPGKPLLTFYNGNPRILGDRVAGEILKEGRGLPSRTHFHGFLMGTTGSVRQLMSRFGLDRRSIKDACVRAVSQQGIACACCH